MTRRNRADRIDVWEHRITKPFAVEFRADAGEITLTGYASTFQPYEMYGGPSNGMGWIEQIDRHAFDATLKESPDVMLLINHEGMPLARTKSKTLKLSADDEGLLTVARLDTSDPDVQRLESKMRRGDMDEMSFAFRTRAQRWEAAPGFEDDPESLRTILDVNLHKGDVSVVNFGANPTTSAEIKSVKQALSVLAECAPDELAEARLDDELIVRARSVLDKLGSIPGDTAPHPPADDVKRGMPLREALIRQGLASPDGPMSVTAALALAGE